MKIPCVVPESVDIVIEAFYNLFTYFVCHNSPIKKNAKGFGTTRKEPVISGNITTYANIKDLDRFDTVEVEL